MNNEKAIELLEKWKSEVDEYRRLGGSNTTDGILATVAFYSHIEPILDLLRQPVCKTCEETENKIIELLELSIESCYEAEVFNGRGWWATTRARLQKVLNLLNQQTERIKHLELLLDQEKQINNELVKECDQQARGLEIEKANNRRLAGILEDIQITSF